MSLINDALKRAKQAQQKDPAPAPPPPAVPMSPVEAPARPATPTRSLLFPIIVAFLLVITGAVVITFAIKSGGSKTESPNNTLAKTPTVSTLATTPVAPVTPSATPTTPAARATNTVTGAPVASPASSNSNGGPAVAPTIVTQAVAVVAKVDPITNAATVAPTVPKLQGILYNPARPTAFLNGKSYVIGGRVGEFTVVGITKQSVTVERAGQTNVLTMEE